VTRFFLRHPVTTWMLFSGFVVLGVYALPKLKIEALPEVDLPTITISTSWNGASPEAIQRSITLPIEEAAQQVHGVEKVSSTSRPGQSQVEISFRRDIDIDFARVELNEQLGSVRRDLPLGAGQPEILPYIPEEFQTDEFFTFSLESTLSPNELREHAEDWIVPQLLAVEGVADARVQGGARALLRIVLDRTRLDLYGITADEVFRAVDGLDALAGAGAVSQNGVEKLLAVRDPVDVRTLEGAVVARRGDTLFRLSQLGRVEASHEDPDYFVRANGDNVVRLSVEKRSGANTVTVSKAVRNALPRIQTSLPFPAAFHVDTDQGKDLRDKLVELVYRSLAILAVLFVILAVSLRQVRLTGIVIASILFAIVISLSLFYFLKISVNFITISGLTVCFGMLLDNSILVLDAIHRRVETVSRSSELDLSRSARLRVAAEMIVSGTREVLFPILATTLTTIVAFVSFIFLSGRLALFYTPLAISVATAMMASLFVAFGWIPVALNQGWARPLADKAPDGANDLTDPEAMRAIVDDDAELDARPNWVEKMFLGLQRAWWVVLPPVFVALVVGGLPSIPSQLKFPRVADPDSTLAAAAVVDTSGADSVLAVPPPLWARLRATRVVVDSVETDDFFAKHASWFPYKWIGYVHGTKVIKGGFWKMPDQEELFLYLEMPAGTDIEVTTETLAKFEQALLPIPEGARMTSNTWGNQAVIRVEFEDAVLKTEVPTKYRYALVEVADATGGASVFIRGFADRPYFKGPFMGSALNSLIKITGYNSKRLNQIADSALDRIDRQRRVRNARITSGNRFDRSFTDETVLTLDRDALAEHDLSVVEVVAYVRRMLGVDTPWTMQVDGKTQRMQLSYSDAENIEYSDVAGRTITNAAGQRVKLLDLVHLETRPVKGSITRENQRYTMYVNWEYVGTDRMRRNYIQSVLKEMQIPYGYSAEEARQEFLDQGEKEQLALTVILAIVFIYMVMAALFESLSLPLLILISLPMALGGVYAAFWITAATFDSSAQIGLVLLFGIVVNNAILLVSRFRTEATLVLKARLGGDPEARAALFEGERKNLGGSDLWMVDASERARLLRRAVARGVRVRMRSILLTSLTTVAGLAPLLIHFNKVEGRDIWENLALSSIGGLVSSTLLLVFVLPPLYYAVIRTKWFFMGLGGRLRAPSAHRAQGDEPHPEGATPAGA